MTSILWSVVFYIFTIVSMQFFSQFHQILVWTWWTIQLHWRKFVILILLLWVWWWAMTYGITEYFADLPLVFEGDEITLDPAVITWKTVVEVWEIFQPAAISFLAIGIVTIVVLLLVQIMVTKLSLHSTHQEVGDTASFSLKKILPYIGTSIFQSFLLFLLYLLLIIPGIIYSIYWLFSTIEVVATDNRYKQAMNASKSIVSWRWRKTAVYLLLIIILIWLLQVLIVQLITLIPDVSIADALLSLLWRIVQIFVMIVMTHFYLVWKSSIVLAQAEQASV